MRFIRLRRLHHPCRKASMICSGVRLAVSFLSMPRNFFLRRTKTMLDRSIVRRSCWRARIRWSEVGSLVARANSSLRTCLATSRSWSRRCSKSRLGFRSKKTPSWASPSSQSQRRTPCLRRLSLGIRYPKLNFKRSRRSVRRIMCKSDISENYHGPPKMVPTRSRTSNYLIRTTMAAW